LSVASLANDLHGADKSFASGSDDTVHERRRQHGEDDAMEVSAWRTTR
jgi:hypothetical protein